MSTGEILLEANQELIAAGDLSRMIGDGDRERRHLLPRNATKRATSLSMTLKKDAVKAQNEALLEIYRKLRPGDPPTLDTATQLFQGMFFDARKYDFSRVGRMKFNIKLYDNSGATPLDKRTLDRRRFHQHHSLPVEATTRRGRRG